jgi:hypothetical protein
MNSHDSLIVATQIAEAKGQILDAIKASKSYTLKDLAPMIGAIGVGLLSAVIAIWSLRRNTKYDREKRADDRKKETLHIIRKIYGELVALNAQFKSELIEMNADKISYEYYMSAPIENKKEVEENQAQFEKYMEDFSKGVKNVNVIIHKYLSTLAEYKFLTNSIRINYAIGSLKTMELDVIFEQSFKDVKPEERFALYEKLMNKSVDVITEKISSFGNQIETAILTDKELFH